jgi:L-amino acid N-acyltransferase YncA
VANSDESDVVMLHRSERQATAPSNKSLNSQPGEDPRLYEPSVREDKPMEDTKRRPVRFKNPPQTPVRVSKIKRVEASPEALEELKQLQAEVIARAGKNRFKEVDFLTSNPEALAKLRDGPGTDPSSDISLRLAKRLVIDHSKNDSELPQGQHGKFEFHERMTEDEKHEAQWEFYRQDIKAYPKIENGQVVLQNDPTPGHPYAPPPASSEDSALISLPQRPEGAELDVWNAAFPANWQYRPLGCTNYEVFRSWFCDWLDSTMGLCYYADIYHKSFFDGTAHADGELSMFIPNISHEETLPDMTDELTRLHHHETSDGYRYNFIHRLQKEEDLRERQKIRARSVYLESQQYEIEPNPNVPKANIYLRPVNITDIPELLKLYNWYVAHATQCVDTEALSDVDLRRRIDDCKRVQLPFIVAVERRAATNGRVVGNQSERIMGYALATDFMGPQTIGRVTADLEVFVDNAKTRLGIGRCLMDKLLEVCDPMYIAKQGYFFNCSQEDRSLYSPGGSRKLTRLVFSFGYSADDPTQYRWVKKWLELNYRFEEQGLLRGAATKFGKS